MAPVYLLWRREWDGSGSDFLAVFTSKADAEDMLQIVQKINISGELLITEVESR
jgi:hypothetical protein